MVGAMDMSTTLNISLGIVIGFALRHFGPLLIAYLIANWSGRHGQAQ